VAVYLLKKEVEKIRLQVLFRLQVHIVRGNNCIMSALTHYHHMRLPPGMATHTKMHKKSKTKKRPPIALWLNKRHHGKWSQKQLLESTGRIAKAQWSYRRRCTWLPRQRCIGLEHPSNWCIGWSRCWALCCWTPCTCVVHDLLDNVLSIVRHLVGGIDHKASCVWSSFGRGSARRAGSTLCLGGCLVASHNLPHFTLGKFDQVGKCLVHN